MATSQSNPFDQFDAPAANPFDQFDAAPAPTPAAPAPEAEDAPVPERNWYDPVRATLQGMTLGASDEIGSGAAAVGAGVGKLFETGSPSAAWDETTAAYDDIAQTVQDQRKQYEAAHPGEALALNLAGGLATGGAGAGRSAAATALGRTASNVAKAGAIGTGAGYASGDIGNRGTSAGVGGALSSTLAAVPVVGRGLANTLSKRRVVDEIIDASGNVTPLNMADDGWIGDKYQRVVGKAYGGGDIMKQSEDFIERTAKRPETLIKAFREDMFNRSVPTGASPDDIARLKQLPSVERSAAVKDLWSKKGFDMVKGQPFKVDPDNLTKQIADSLDDPALKKNIPKVTELLGTMMDDVKAGTIDGKDLMELRNTFRKAANKMGNEGDAALKKAAYSKAASKIDDLIEDQLPEGMANAFRAEKLAYKNSRTLQKAVGKAEDAKARGGDFEPKDVLSATSIYDRGLNRGALQPEARKAQQILQGKKERLAELESRMPSWGGNHERILATAMLGTPGLGFGLEGLLTGIGTAKFLSRPKVQQAIAGQTGTQKAIADSLRKYDASSASKYLQDLTRGGVRGGIVAGSGE